jgi:hypothetical protein
MRIDCSLCGVKMLDLDLYLSASVNVRYILHTQPLRFIYNKILVWLSLYPSLSLSILVGLSFSNTFCYRCMLSLHLPHSSLLCLINPYSPDDKRRKLLETLVPQQYVNRKMPPTEGRLLSRKTKNDASKTLGKQTKKHHDTLEFCKMNIGSTCNNI